MLKKNLLKFHGWIKFRFNKMFRFSVGLLNIRNDQSIINLLSLVINIKYDWLNKLLNKEKNIEQKKSKYHF